MWTCWKCSYAYNPVSAPSCEICSLPKPPNARDKPRNAAAGGAALLNKSSNNNLQDDFQLVTGDLRVAAAAPVGLCADADDGDQVAMATANGAASDDWVCKR